MLENSKKALLAPLNQHPRVIMTNKYPATVIAIIEDYGDLNCRNKHRMNQYMNKIIEQDYRLKKRRLIQC